MDKGQSQFFQQFCKWNQQDGNGNIKDGVEVCDVVAGDWIVPEGESNGVLEGIDTKQKQKCTNNIEAQVHKCRTFCIFRSADRCHDWGDTGTDILTQNDRNCRSKGDLSGRGKCLKDTDGCGRTLDNSGNTGTGKNTENRIGEVLKQCR